MSPGYLAEVKKRAAAWAALPQPCPSYVIRDMAEALADDVAPLLDHIATLDAANTPNPRPRNTP